MSNETLSQHQRRFAQMAGKLIDWIYANGYEAVLGECKRTQAQADANAASGIGISNSLHLLSCAIDISLFKDGTYLTNTVDYTPVGEYWESIGGSWGGRFSNPDGDHFSLTWQGVR